MGRSTVYNSIVTEEKKKEINKKNQSLMEDFLDYLVSIDRSPATIAQYKNDLYIFFCWNIDENDNKYFVDLTKREIAKFQKHCISAWSWSSNRLSRVKSTLSSMSNYIENMLDDEYENYRPIVRKVETPVKQTIREKTIVTDEEVQTILDTLVEQGRYQCACYFALSAFSGARKSELLRFKVSYFDDENIMDTAALYKTPEKIQTKGRGSQGKMLTKYTLLDFKKYFNLWMKEREDKGYPESEWLFVNEDGTQLSVHKTESFANQISKILGRPWYVHSNRHFLCSKLFRIGLPADIIQEYFGWSSAEMLKIYNDNEASDSFGLYFTKDGVKGAEAKGFGDL